MVQQKEVNPAVDFAKANMYSFISGFGGSVWGAFLAYYGPLMALLGFLGASAFYNGVVNALFWLGFILPQIPAAYFSERLRYKKWAMGYIFLLSATSMLLFGLLLYFTGGENKDFLLKAFLICYAFATIVAGAATPFAFTLLSKIIPPAKLGSWLGIYFMLGAVGGLVGGPVVTKILGYGYPAGFEMLFFGMFICTIIMTVSIWFINEPEGKLAPRKENFGLYLKHVINIIKKDRNLVRFFIGMWIVVGHYIALTFYTRYATTGGFGIGNAQAGTFVTMHLLGYFLASQGPLFIILFPLAYLLKLSGRPMKIPSNIFGAGWIADRFGPKFTLITFQAVALVGVILAFFANNLLMFCFVWILAGFAQICNNIGYTNMTLQSCPIEDKSTYIGIVNFAVFPMVVIVPMIFGALIDKGLLTFNGTFKISMVLMIISIIYILYLVDNPEGFKKLKMEKETQEVPGDSASS